MRSCPELASCPHAGIGTSCGRTLLLFFQDYQRIFQCCKTTELIRETIPVVSQYKVNISRLQEGFCNCSCLGYPPSEASSYCPLIFSVLRQVQPHTKFGKKVDYWIKVQISWRHLFPPPKEGLPTNIWYSGSVRKFMVSIKKAFTKWLTLWESWDDWKSAMYGFTTTLVMKLIFWCLVQCIIKANNHRGNTVISPFPTICRSINAPASSIER